MSSIVAVDTKASNLASVINAIRRIGVDVTVTNEAEKIAAANVILLPGVGAFEMAMGELRDRNLVEVLRRKALEERVPFFGICLGMQLMADQSGEHGSHAGLGLIPGRVTRLQPTIQQYRVPNIGWYDVTAAKDGRLFPADVPSRSFYFVHSYHFVCDSVADEAASIDYSGQKTTAAIERDNLFGCQFHPEKSLDAGLDLLERFFRTVLR